MSISLSFSNSMPAVLTLDFFFLIQEHSTTPSDGSNVALVTTQTSCDPGLQYLLSFPSYIHSKACN